MTRPSVLLGMSGGVDSSVAAALLVRQGYEVHGLTLQVWEQEDESMPTSKKWQERSCCKVGLAKHVAKVLNIPHDVLDTRERFRTGVIEDFLHGYTNGTTPNPCVRCNERVKIRTLIDTATARGFDYVATGHYARIQRDGPSPVLSRAADPRKDQTYFLYRLHPQWLHKLLFPIGELQKSVVWEEAEALGLPADEIKESQEICFVTQGDYRTFIENQLPAAKKPGFFIDEAGLPLGQHNGIAFYTPGQRRGLGIAARQRLYVQQVNPSTNTVLLGPEESLLKNECTVSDLNLFAPRLAQGEAELHVKLRYATPATPATVSPIDSANLCIRFHHPQRAISPGQSAVFYEGDAIVGGGIIQPF